MKKGLLAGLCLAVVCMCLIGCQKGKDNDTEQPQNTTLEVSVVDASGQAASGVAVRLYISENDWNKNQNVKFAGTTNAQGKAKFESVNAVKYWIQTERSCENNIYGITSTNGAITERQANTLTITIAGTGTMVFKNTLNNSCELFINGIFEKTMPAKSQFTINYVSVGFKTVRMVENALFLAEDITYTGTLSCGGTLTTTFP